MEQKLEKLQKSDREITMSRETFKSNQYFKDRIDKLNKFIKEDVEEIKLGKIDKEWISGVSLGNFRFGIDILYSMYSMGYNTDKMNEYYPEVISLLSSPENAWPEHVVPRIPDFRLHDLLMMLSFGILFDVPKNLINQIIEVVDLAPERYRVLEYFISYYDDKREVPSSIKISEHAFEEFSSLFDLSNDEITSKNLIGKYLETWYDDEDRVHMHNTHNSGLDNYYGYWSFESAAFVKMRGLDDSALRDKSPFYPKDLI